jgi:group I intron endonuclease
MAIYQLPGIYMIKNNVNGKMYVGSSVNLINRMNGHINNSHNQSLANDLKIFGIAAFSYTVLEFCPMRIDEDLPSFRKRLVDAEQKYMDAYLKSSSDKVYFDAIAYNTHYKSSGPSGIIRGAETREKLRVINTGRKMPRESVIKAAKSRLNAYNEKIISEYGSLSNYWKARREHKNSSRRKRREDILSNIGASVACYDIDGVFIKKFNSQAEAYVEFKIAGGGISRAIKTNVLCKNMYWTLYGESSELGINVPILNRLVVYSHGVEIGRFASILAISKFIGRSRVAITTYLNRKDKDGLLYGQFRIEDISEQEFSVEA